MTETMHQTHKTALRTRRDRRGEQFLGSAHERPSDRHQRATGGQRQARAGLRAATDPRSCAEPVSQPRPPRFFEDQVRPDIADGPPAAFFLESVFSGRC